MGIVDYIFELGQVKNEWILSITSLTTALDKYCQAASLTIIYAKC
jgi:hypothetical protein